MKMPKIKVVFDVLNRVTIATAFYNGRKYKGIAFCSDGDAFDEEIGRIIAVSRLRKKLFKVEEKAAQKEVFRLSNELVFSSAKAIEAAETYITEAIYLDDFIAKLELVENIYEYEEEICEVCGELYDNCVCIKNEDEDEKPVTTPCGKCRHCFCGD